MTILQAKNITYGYQDGQSFRTILNDVDVEFEKGVFYTILGRSGSGKTTLLSLLSAMDVPQSGSICYEEQDIQKLGLRTYRQKHMGIIFQSFHLIPYMSGLQNVLVAMSITRQGKNAKRKALQTLEDLGIDEATAKRQVKTLSGGEQQRIAIARALSTGANILLADEPTGNLDKATQNEIIQVFQKLAHEQGQCVIVVTHSRDVAKASDQVLKMKEGKLVA